MASVSFLVNRNENFLEDYERRLTNMDDEFFLEYNGEKNLMMSRSQATKRKACESIERRESFESIDSCSDDEHMEGADDNNWHHADPFDCLPEECCNMILLKLEEKDLIHAACVSRKWHDSVMNESLFKILLNKTFPKKQLIEAKGVWHMNAVDAFRTLRKWHQCLLCETRYRAGDNVPDSCGFHSGVLFSGGNMNGIALYWTCCNLMPSSHESGKRFQPRGCERQRHFNPNCAFEVNDTNITKYRNRVMCLAANDACKPRPLPPSWLPKPDVWRRVIGELQETV